MARTRDPDVDRRIHEATVALLQRVGLGDLSIEEVAATAGVGKAAIYRRYASKEELVVGAVDAVLPMAAPDRALDGPAALAALVEDLRSALFDAGGLGLLATLLVAADRQPDLLDLWRRRIVAPRVATIRAALDDAGASAAVDAQTVGELALGGLVARSLARGDVSPAAGRTLAEHLWRLITAQPGVTPHETEDDR